MLSSSEWKFCANNIFKFCNIFNSKPLKKHIYVLMDFYILKRSKRWLIKLWKNIGFWAKQGMMDSFFIRKTAPNSGSKVVLVFKCIPSNDMLLAKNVIILEKFFEIWLIVKVIIYNLKRKMTQFPKTLQITWNYHTLKTV